MVFLLRCFALLVCISAAPAWAAERYALVIGNNAYPNLAADEQLRKAVNDADAVGDTLERLGFTVMRGTDLGRSAMLARLSAFRQSLQPGDTGFVYFSGHGVAIDGANYLLPADIPDSADEDVVIQSAVAETYVEGLLSKAGVKTGILVLDACRNNPFTATGQKAIGGAKGLMRADPPGGVFKLYAAGTGETALDRLPGNDPDPNSVFTRILLPELERPGQSLVGVAYAVKAKVTALAATVGHAQHPAQYDGGFANTVYLAGETPVEPSATVAPSTVAALPHSCSEAKAHYEEAARRNSVSGLRAHLKFYGTCAYAAFAEEALAATEAPAVVAASPKTQASSIASPPDRRPQGSRPVRTPVEDTSVPKSPARDAAINPVEGRTDDDKAPIDESSAVHCDRLAALQTDPDRSRDAAGVPLRDVTLEAIPVCERAANGHPGERRYSFQLGRAYEASERYEDAMRAYQKAADLGSYAAMRNIGGLFEEAKGYPKNYAPVPNYVTAAWMYEKASGGGNTEAMLSLARLYVEGKGVIQSDADAAGWYQKAAAAGNERAMIELGLLYDKGQGVTQSYAGAMRWYRMAADVGNADAMNNIGSLYDNGGGVPADAFEAAKWVERALRSGSGFSRDQMRTNSANWTPEFRRALQARLKDAGVYDGALDGEFGPSTQSAIDAIFGKAG